MLYWYCRTELHNKRNGGNAMKTPYPEPNFYENEPSAPQGKRRTWLWILGWLLIFPLPLTILLLRSRRLDNKVKYGIIAGAWVLYLVIALAAPKGGDDTRELPAAPEPAATESAAQTTTKATVKTTTETTVETQSPAAEPDETEKAGTKPEISGSDIRKMVTDGDYSLVTPEFRKTMDAYEAFYDKYIDFMKKYTADGADAGNMLGDYMDMMNQLAEWNDKMDGIDESTLSDADDAYFLLVTLRIEKKLLSIGLTT